MVEIVIAMAIFAIGFVAVCAIFPVALTLQRETVDDVTAQQVGRNVKAILAAQEDDFVDKDVFDYAGYKTDWELDGGLVLSPDFANSTFLTDLLPPSLRTYPSAQADLSLRTTSWVPLVRRSTDATNPGWYIYTLVMTRRPTDTWPGKASDSANPDDPETIPEVASATVNATVGSSSLTVTGGTPMTDFTVGMLILDNCGNEYRVQGVQGSTLYLGTSTIVVGHPTTGDPPTAIWYARPAGPGKSSPLRRIETTFWKAKDDSFTPWERIFNDTDPVCSWIGGSLWQERSGATWTDYQKDMHQYNGTSSSDYFSWTITVPEPGNYRLWLTWVPAGNRSASVAYAILDGTDVLDAGTIDQQSSPGSDMFDGSYFREFPTVAVSSTTVEFRLSPGPGGVTIADAVRIERRP